MKLRIFVICAALAFMCFSFSLQAMAAGSPPVVIELFGKNACSDDTDVQDEVQNLMRKQDNVIFINCRKYYEGNREIATLTHDFCNQRSDAYNKRLELDGYITPLIIVNGRWDAYRRNVAPAVKLGETDQVKDISVKRNADRLDIEVPEIAGYSSGEILLYTYTLSQRDDVVTPRADALSMSLPKENLPVLENFPLITQQTVDLFLFRPVISIENIGHWRGDRMEVTYPLKKHMWGDDIQKPSDLSYAITLHADDEYGVVLAAGETVSMAEKNYFLPRSVPKNGLNPAPDL